ncbi:UNVERIFIED_CONTAM: hypothetical protein Sangu_0385900 [Sesamum angustifolium]|uniref:Ribosomal protein L4 n=1 Tax=Sesamum angustifolium TaxID=2727405 RepID=A0AAW2QSA2_9LAMI
MTNEIQKLYDRLDEVPLIMLRMKEVYPVPDRHIRYAATKAFFLTKMAKGSSIQSYGIKMLSIVEKLKNFKAGLDNNTYINVILHHFLHPTTRDASTSRVKGRRVGGWKRKKGKGKFVIATTSAEGTPAAPMGKG